MVVKFRAVLNALVPAPFFARTRQKYCVLLASDVTCLDVVVIVESFRIRDPNNESVDTCSRYEVAPLDAPQLKGRVVG